MCKFNIGDLVTCIDDQNAVGLTVGQLYLVQGIIDDKTIEVMADNRKPGTFWVGRFVSANHTSSATTTLPKGIPVDGLCDIDDFLVYSPGMAKPLECDMGCKFLGDTHFVNCKAYNPDRKVEF
jgi:hypothetical protein